MRLRDLYIAAAEVISVYPNDIKFHFRLGIFLLKVVNNENEGTEYFKKAGDLF